MVDEENLTIVTPEKIYGKCSTMTFVAKVESGQRISIEELKSLFPNSYETKFRNCIIQKFGKHCLKIYTNLSIHVTGVTSLEDFLSLMNNVNCFDCEYKAYCAMCNWPVKLKNKIDLCKTMKIMNDSGFMSYFLRGYPLINKIDTNFNMDFFILSKNSSGNYYVKQKYICPINKTVTILMHKSGNCIVSGPSEIECSKAVLTVKPYLV